MFENPTVNFNAFCSSCAKIACCSSELIFTFLYAGSSIQNVSEIFLLLIHLSFENFALSPNPTNTNRTSPFHPTPETQTERSWVWRSLWPINGATAADPSTKGNFDMYMSLAEYFH
jgi:hypothetical protein